MRTALAAFVLLAYGQGTQSALIKPYAEVDWKVSSTLPADPTSHEYHLIHEDPATHGVQTLVRFAKGFSMPIHTHSHDETVVVLRGKLGLAVGSSETVLEPGGYAFIPAGTPHSMRTVGWGRCELVAAFSGPIDFKVPGQP